MSLRLRSRPAVGSNATLRPSSQRRFKQRARRRRLLSLRPLLICLGLIGLLVLAGWVLLGSTLLAVHSVAVSGESRLDVEEVKAAAQVPADKPLALLDTGAIRRRVAALPEVKSATVERAWPTSVHIRVVERTAVAVVQRPGKPLALVDATGVLFADVTAPPPGLSLLSLAAPAAGDPSTIAALAVTAALPTKVRQTVTLISAPTPATVTLTLTGGISVIWGDAANSARKAQALAAVLKAQATAPVVTDKRGHVVPPKKISVIDVSSPEVLTTK
ncbi:MAG: FtsQ-type POTRA domain-containing protein [Pseudonocardiales bacterium]|nr:FtsQ-type POTRA domain-containing protein [Pseudonocardiales bacterium]